METAAQTVERNLTTILRTIKGVQVYAYGQDDADRPVESWQAVSIAFTISAPVTSDAAKYIATELEQIGAREVTVSAYTGTAKGVNAKVNVSQHRISGLVDDAAADKLIGLVLEFTDGEREQVTATMKKARSVSNRLDGRQAAKLKKKQRRPCAWCGNPIDPSERSAMARSCSNQCAMQLQHQGASKGGYAKAARQTGDASV
jgi:hypothetical protein